MIIGGNDYLETEPQSFIFDSSRSRHTFKITIVNDNAFELTEFFYASLRFADAAPPRVTLDPSQAEITILDDDGEKNPFTKCYSDQSIVAAYLSLVVY